jgi:hypothetical protein
MKTLTEVEPRVAVQTLPGDATALFLISQPGSYYLTGNINGVSGKAAIAINADNVTLDLGGHALLGVGGATRGVELRGTHSQIVVRHGSLRGFDSGVVTSTGTVSNVRVEGVSVINIANGDGIAIVGEGTRVRDCELTSIGGSGILVSTNSGLVDNCVVQGCSDPQSLIGISARTVVSCTVANITSTGSGATGISASTVSECAVSTVSGALTSTGVVGVTATGCRISGIGSGTGDIGAATGLSTRSASTCSVTTVGAPGSTSAPFGIVSLTVTGCDVDSIGHTASAVGATGISADSVSSSRVSNIRGGSAGNVNGILAATVSGCNVDSLSQGSSSGAVTGIASDVVIGCRLSSIAGATTATVCAIGASANVRDCSVNAVSNSGSGTSAGLLRASSTAGSVENCVFRSTGDVGISVTSRQRIIGCTISTTTTGILATGVRNVIDGTNIDTCTTGINAVSGANTANALIVRNQIRNCTSNIAVDPPCQVGPIVTAPGTIASTNPWANFTD